MAPSGPPALTGIYDSRGEEMAPSQPPPPGEEQMAPTQPPPMGEGPRSPPDGPGPRPTGVWEGS